ncbi:GAF domain-containing protein [uncultured Friedmanniella sp.]|uniref:GAF domain-containing protein n=1 Tax=uncultured Friedmanniella sp. TaxID=335381 RepID=UPI0035CAF649
MGPPSLALPPGSDPRQLTRYLRSAHDAFVSTGHLDRSLRPLVVDSWRRSVESGVDPESTLAPIRLDDARLAQIRASHPLALVMPVIRRLLVDPAAESGLLVAVSDAAGRLLWVEGDVSLRSQAESMHFLAGADWSEAVAGTNAPGTALALDAPVQILGAEHLSRPVTPWSCSAVPIHEPDTGAVLGVLDLTGGAEVVTLQTLTLVRATVAAVEAELRLERLRPVRPRSVASGWTSPTLSLLGRRSAQLGYGGHDDGSTTTTLSPRHSEILLLLTEADGGLSADQLAVALSEEDHPSVTIRAELSRLRTLLGPVRLGSRPYRVLDALRTDVADVRRELRSGRVRQAVAAYRGPVLPASTAPGVERLRDELHQLLRSALLGAGDPDALLSFADTAHGRDDSEVWRAALTALPASSPRYAQVAGHVDRLDQTLGCGATLLQPRRA